MAQTEKIRRNSQELRKNMTKEERHLWYDFLKTYPVQFRRQYSFGNYIVAFREEKGLYVMRISNLDVMREFTGVCDMIHQAVQNRLSR